MARRRVLLLPLALILAGCASPDPVPAADSAPESPGGTGAVPLFRGPNPADRYYENATVTVDGQAYLVRMISLDCGTNQHPWVEYNVGGATRGICVDIAWVGTATPETWDAPVPVTLVVQVDGRNVTRVAETLRPGEEKRVSIVPPLPYDSRPHDVGFYGVESTFRYLPVPLQGEWVVGPRVDLRLVDLQQEGDGRWNWTLDVRIHQPVPTVRSILLEIEWPLGIGPEIPARNGTHHVVGYDHYTRSEYVGARLLCADQPGGCLPEPFQLYTWRIGRPSDPSPSLGAPVDVTPAAPAPQTEDRPPVAAPWVLLRVTPPESFGPWAGRIVGGGSHIYAFHAPLTERLDPVTGEVERYEVELGPDELPFSSEVWAGDGAYLLVPTRRDCSYCHVESMRVVRFDAATGSFSNESPSWATGRSSQSLAWTGSEIYAFGGMWSGVRDTHQSAEILRIRPGASEPELLEVHLPRALVGLEAMYDGTNVYLWGGYSYAGHNSYYGGLLRFEPEPPRVTDLGWSGTVRATAWTGSEAFVVGERPAFVNFTTGEARFFASSPPEGISDCVFVTSGIHCVTVEHSGGESFLHLWRYDPSADAVWVPPQAPPPPPPPPELHVEIRGSAYFPGDLATNYGSMIRWTNNDSIAHTVTADEGEFGSPRIQPGESFTFLEQRHLSREAAPVTLHYHCAVHPWMRGSLTVGPAT